MTWDVPRLHPNPPSGREVVEIRDDATVMQVLDDGAAKAFAKQLIRSGKAFHCEPLIRKVDGRDVWEFVVYEENERGGMAGVWE